MQIGSNALNSTDSHSILKPTAYARQLAERRESEEIRQLASFGITVGWVFALVGGFCWFCVISRIDWVWSSMLISGIGLLTLGTVIPQLLYWPHRIWMGIAHFQGRIMMSLLLTIVYFGLIWPLGTWERHRVGRRNPFMSWDSTPPDITSNWSLLPTDQIGHQVIGQKSNRVRSMIVLFMDSIRFFVDRGHYLLLPVLLLLLILGLVLFFVQSSVIAPFIYTL